MVGTSGSNGTMAVPKFNEDKLFHKGIDPTITLIVNEDETINST